MRAQKLRNYCPSCFTESLLVAEDRANRAEKDLKNFQESVAIQMSTGSRMVEATPLGIRERIKDIQIELKEKNFVRCSPSS